jgi:hypothetical protein
VSVVPFSMCIISYVIFVGSDSAKPGLRADIGVQKVDVVVLCFLIGGRCTPLPKPRCFPLAGAAHHLERSAALYWPDPSPKPVRKMSRCAK